MYCYALKCLKLILILFPIWRNNCDRFEKHKCKNKSGLNCFNTWYFLWSLIERNYGQKYKNVSLMAILGKKRPFFPKLTWKFKVYSLLEITKPGGLKTKTSMFVLFWVTNLLFWYEWTSQWCKHSVSWCSVSEILC